MATVNKKKVNALIAYKQKSGRIKALHLFEGGSMEEAGDTLFMFYTTDSKVNKLLKVGELMTLKHPVEQSKLYQSEFPPYRIKSLKELIGKADEWDMANVYLFKNKIWYYLDDDYNWVTLLEALF